MKTRSKRITSYLLCILIAVTALTACSKGPSPGEPGGDAPVIITVWYTLQGQQEQALLTQFERINKEYPEVLITGEKFSESGFVQRVYNYQAGGEGPEIMIAQRQILFSLYEKGMISPVLAETDAMYSSVKAVFYFNKQSFAAPWLTNTPILYYRKDKITVPPASIAEILEKKANIAASAISLDLLSPWWIAEGGTLSVNGVPALDSAANAAFFNKMLALKQQGRLLVDSQALAKFKKGEVDYLLAWGSDMAKLTAVGNNIGCLSLYSLFSDKGQSVLSNTIGIANSSIKTIPETESAIRLVEEELLKSTSEETAFSAGGGLPANSGFYTSAQASTFHAETGLSLQNARYLEGSRYDWKYWDLLDEAWTNINSGANSASELSRIEQQAMALKKSITK